MSEHGREAPVTSRGPGHRGGFRTTGAPRHTTATDLSTALRTVHRVHVGVSRCPRWVRIRRSCLEAAKWTLLGVSRCVIGRFRSGRRRERISDQRSPAAQPYDIPAMSHMNVPTSPRNTGCADDGLDGRNWNNDLRSVAYQFGVSVGRPKAQQQIRPVSRRIAIAGRRWRAYFC